jgi:hypothetical protein
VEAFEPSGFRGARHTAPVVAGKKNITVSPLTVIAKLKAMSGSEEQLYMLL